MKLDISSLRQYIRPFDAFNPYELYALLRLRSEVFVVEQHCAYLDADNKDQLCHHLLIYQDETLAAYARLVPPDISYPEMSIGRIVTSKAARGIGLGKELMKRSIQACYDLFGEASIRIGAQVYAIPFYESLGFVVDGEVYDEDGIDHVEMIKKVEA
ncbi:GNAT family N-acetyltransferase [Olivibacter sp. CPCC 100613]|uniref:GNAT family N-acetyltransferase n=1 Tax=Olivibacter sp. CPCC 100613 TaxID=3079931 RepID=UPI002FF6530D